MHCKTAAYEITVAQEMYNNPDDTAPHEINDPQPIKHNSDSKVLVQTTTTMMTTRVTRVMRGHAGDVQDALAGCGRALELDPDSVELQGMRKELEASAAPADWYALRERAEARYRLHVAASSLLLVSGRLMRACVISWRRCHDVSGGCCAHIVCSVIHFHY